MSPFEIFGECGKPMGILSFIGTVGRRRTANTADYLLRSIVKPEAPSAEIETPIQYGLTTSSLLAAPQTIPRESNLTPNQATPYVCTESSELEDESQWETRILFNKKGVKEVLSNYSKQFIFKIKLK